MKKVKSNNQGTWLSIAFVLIVFGIMMLVSGRENIKSAFTGAYDIYDVDAEDIKIGDGIKTSIYAVLDTYGTLETTTKNSKTGSVTGRTYHYYYIIPVFNEDDDDTYFMSVKVSSDDKKAFDRIADDTWDVLLGDADYFTDVEFEAEGNIQKLDDEGYEYMVEWFEDMEWFGTDDRDDFEQYLLPICLELKNLKTTSIMVYVSMGVILLGVLVIVIHFVRKSNKKKKEASEQAAFNNGYAAASSDNAGSSNSETVQTGTAQTDTTSYANGVDSVLIAGNRVPKADADRINGYVAAGDEITAIREFRDITGLGINEAKEIIDNWGNYYR